jgi:hypothetical protein
MIPGSASTEFFGAAGAAGGGAYEISRSLRFNSADSAYLNRTPASAGNRKTWTWAGWVKRTSLATGTDQVLFCGGETNSATGFLGIYYENNGIFTLGSSINILNSTPVYRDPGAWAHILFAFDSTAGTNSNKAKLYVNGTEVTAFNIDNRSTITNQDYGINQAARHEIGRQTLTSARYFDGYLAEVHFIDGQALDPSSFTTTDLTTGQLIPIAYTGSYGTNGFKLNFSDNSTTAALGTDTSGNGNTWTVNNFQATVQTGRLYAQASGTATSAFSSATLLGNFPATVGGSYAIYDADLLTSTTSATFSYTYSFIGVVEVLVSADGTSWTSKGLQSSSYTTVTNASAFRYVRWFYSTFNFGINNNPGGNDSLLDTPTSYGTDTGVGGEVRGNYATLNPLQLSGSNRITLSNGNLQGAGNSIYYGSAISTISVNSGKWYAEFTFTLASTFPLTGIIKTSPLSSTYQNSDDQLLGRTADAYGYRNDQKLYNNNSFSTYGASWTDGDVIGVALDLDAGTLTFYKNGASQGQAASGLSGYYAIGCSVYSSAVCNANFGQRSWAYAAPSGFKALCDTNLPTPVVAKPNTVMDVKLYTGNGGTQTVSGLAFEPDFVWLKGRSVGYSHQLYDQVRGAGKLLGSNSTSAEATVTDNLTAFTSTGFTLGNDAGTNQSSATYVGWAWDAGTTTVSNTQGSITSQVRANPSAGFSVVTHTSTGAAGTVGHGLGVQPLVVLTKVRSTTSNWEWRTTVIDGSHDLLLLNTTGAKIDSGAASPTSTVFTDVWNNGETAVTYCFAPVAGYSSFGSYTGNGSDNGPFVYTGFKVKWLMIKRTDSTSNWYMIDAARSPYNEVNDLLYAEQSLAETADDGNNGVDFLSNGFKLRKGVGGTNVNGATLIYAAFAENPFQYARAR